MLIDVIMLHAMRDTNILIVSHFVRSGWSLHNADDVVGCQSVCVNPLS
jgi:hypothetical protein